MFCAGPGDADNIDFLKCVIPDERRRHLPRQYDHWDRVHISGGYARNSVGGARTGSHETDPDPAGSPGISVGHVRGPLLVTNQNVPYVMSRHLVVDVKNRTTREPEYDLHPFALERF